MTDSFSLFESLPEEKSAKKGSKKPKVVVEEPVDLFGEPVALPPQVSEEDELEVTPLSSSSSPSVIEVEPLKPERLPDFLESIWGQERPKLVLKRLIEENHLPHALLLYGPDGIGKQALAIDLARHLNCEYGPLTACGICPSCKQFASLQHSSLFLAFPTKANDGEIDKKETLESGEVRITRRYSQKTEDEIADTIADTAKDRWTPLAVTGATNVRVITVRFLRHWAQLGAWLGQGRKVAIIAQAHRMNEETSNALLKILEEPPPDTLLILLAKSPEELLPTIQSRCQSIRLEPLPAELIRSKLMSYSADKLRRSNALTEHDAMEIAELSEGNFFRAREAAADEFSVKTEEAIEFLLGCVVSKQRRELLTHIDRFSRTRNPEEVDKFLFRIVWFLRDALRIRQHKGEGLPGGLMVRDESLLERLVKFSSFTSKRDLVGAIDEVLRAQDLLRRRNPQFSLLLHALSYRLSRILAA